MRTDGEGRRIPAAAAREGLDLGERPTGLSSGALLKEIAQEVRHLVKAQFELAKVEVRANVTTEARTAAGLGIAAAMGLVGVTLLLVTAIFALALVLPGWAAGLIVSGVVLGAAAIIGMVGWRRRVRRPLPRTRHEIEEEVKWTKEQVT